MDNNSYFNTWGYVDGVDNYIALSSKSVSNEQIQSLVDKSFSTTKLTSEGQELQLSINGKNVSTVVIEDKYLQHINFDEGTKELVFSIGDDSDELRIDLSKVLSGFATKQDVEDKLNNLVDNAPKALDSLYELSNALGNDPNFATTVFTEIGKKINKTEVYTRDESNDLFQPKGNYLTEHQDISNLATKEEVDNVINSIPSTDNLATETYVDEKIAAIPPVDLSEYATKEDIKNSVKYQEFGENRKTIQLNNYDSISGIDTKGTGHNLVMLSKWDVADFGAAGIKMNLNGSEERPTYNDNKEIALLDDVNSVDNKLSNYITKEEVSNGYQVKGDYLTEHQSLENYPTKDDLKSEMDKTVQFTTSEYQGRTKKVITLDNDELINAKSNSEDLENKVDVNGKAISLIQLNRWNVVDIGSPYTLTNINTPDGVRPTIQEKSQSGPEAHKIAYVDDVAILNQALENAKVTLLTMTDKFNMLNSKFETLSKSNVEVVSDFTGNDTLNDETKDYEIVNPSLTVPSTILGKSVNIVNATIVPASAMTSEVKRSPISIKARDININGIKVTGQFDTNLNSNAVVSVNEGEFIEVKDAVFDGTNFYNGFEIGLNNDEILPKNVIFDNCRFLNYFTHNAFSVFRMQDNATITLNNCYFEDIVGVMRISNYTNAKNITININNCVLDKVNNNIGLILFQDSQNKTSEEFYETNRFGNGKFTVNINNLIANGQKVTSDTTIGAGAASCAINVYAKKIGYLSYNEDNKQYFPTVNFN